MIYINGEYQGRTETIDEAETMKDARYLLQEYRMAFGPEWLLWISQRPTNDWRDRD